VTSRSNISTGGWVNVSWLVWVSGLAWVSVGERGLVWVSVG
jgi:hypothetical protein